MDPEIIRVVHPREYYARFFDKGVRPDGRRLNEGRKVRTAGRMDVG